jgi:iron(III) transport system substrate-binding protein
MISLRSSRSPRGATATRTAWHVSLVLLACLTAVALTACGSDSAASGADRKLASETGPAGDAAWQRLVKDAKAEGKVVIYASHSADTLDKLAAAFKKQYGIGVTVFRAPDNDLEPKLDAEAKTGNRVADLVGMTDQAYLKKRAAGNAFVKAKGPALTAQGFDPAANTLAPDVLRSAATTMSYAWNTSLHPKGLKDFNGLLDPSLTGGKIGILSPIAPAVMDFYSYLEKQYGADFLDRLAAQKPRIYNAGDAMVSALASGEIEAASQVSQVALYHAKDTGAPVDGGLANPAWSASFYEAVLAGAPHPDAAQLLMNYIFSPAGQEIIAERIAAVLPNIPSALTTVDKTTTGGQVNATPAQFKAFVDKFNATFH